VEPGGRVRLQDGLPVGQQVEGAPLSREQGLKALEGLEHVVVTTAGPVRFRDPDAFRSLPGLRAPGSRASVRSGRTSRVPRGCPRAATGGTGRSAMGALRPAALTGDLGTRRPGWPRVATTGVVSSPGLGPGCQTTRISTRLLPPPYNGEGAKRGTRLRVAGSIPTALGRAHSQRGGADRLGGPNRFLTDQRFVHARAQVSP
jgi:hypothetical protein